MNERFAKWVWVGMLAGLVEACGGASSPEMLLLDTASGDEVPSTSEPAPAAATSDEPAPNEPRVPAKYGDLRVLGPIASPSLAPVRLAARGLYPGVVTLGDGGVSQLCGDAPSADLVVDSETELLRVSVAKRCAELRVLFTVSEGLHRIVAKRSSAIESVADLADKRVLVTRGSPSHHFLTEMAARAGLTR